MALSRSPVCLGCGAKFSHDSTKMECKRCHLPDEIRDQGSQAIARWKRKPMRVVEVAGGVFVMQPDTSLSRRQRKLKRLGVNGQQRLMHSNKHGRVGVKRG